MEGAQVDCSCSVNVLSDKWVLWAHLPHNTDWSLRSYTNICELDTVEKVISLNRTLPEQLYEKLYVIFNEEGYIANVGRSKKFKRWVLFILKFLIKILRMCVEKHFLYANRKTLSKNKKLVESINGITISPKKSFCILKIWMENITFQNVHELNPIPELAFNGCIFKNINQTFKLCNICN